MHPQVHFSLIQITKIMKQCKCPWIDEWIKNEMEYYPVIKKNGILSFVITWMKLEGTVLCEISQTEKNK